MHHLVAKNSLVEGKTTKLGYKGGEGNDLPVCPKPHRPRSAFPRELVKPFKCTNTNSHGNFDGRSEILNMIVTDQKTTEAERESFCYYTGSPPRRTGNPLIHDVQFINQVEIFSQLGISANVRTKNNHI